MAVSCGNGENAGEETQQVTGSVQDVQPFGIDSFASLTIRDSEGQTWTFSDGRFPGFSPSHLLEHRALGEPVTVTYVEQEDGTLRAVEIEDAGG